MPSGHVAGASQGGGAAVRANTQIRCICGSNYDRGTMIQCEVRHFWGHCRITHDAKCHNVSQIAR